MESGNARIGLYLKENTPPDAVVADTAAGSVFYFSRRPGVDFLGKTDPYIAWQAPAYNGTIPGHNKFDYSNSLDERQPDYVVSSFLLPVAEEDMQEASICLHRAAVLPSLLPRALPAQPRQHRHLAHHIQVRVVPGSG